MFDLVMEMRFDRDRARQSKAWTELCTVASRARQEDLRDRGGRPSWSPSERMTAINSVVGR